MLDFAFEPELYFSICSLPFSSSTPSHYLESTLEMMGFSVTTVMAKV